jgi:mediator of RNA polymerase II transcription subunit 14
MSNYTIWDGRVTFVAPHLFKTTLSLRGALEDDGWIFLHVEFLFDIGGGVMSLQGG